MTYDIDEEIELTERGYSILIATFMDGKNNPNAEALNHILDILNDYLKYLKKKRNTYG